MCDGCWGRACSDVESSQIDDMPRWLRCGFCFFSAPSLSFAAMIGSGQTSVASYGAERRVFDYYIGRLNFLLCNSDLQPDTPLTYTRIRLAESGTICTILGVMDIWVEFEVLSVLSWSTERETSRTSWPSVLRSHFCIHRFPKGVCKLLPGPERSRIRTTQANR